MTIPKALQAHAKKNGMKIVSDPKRKGVAIYQKKGKDIVAFNLSDATDDWPALQTVLDKALNYPKVAKGEEE
jgi:hypothetical protein